MTANEKKPRSQSPVKALIDDARAGRLSVRMDLEKFVYLDRDCNFFKLGIRNIQQLMTQVSQQEHWGLGEGHVPDDGRDLVSSKTMVKRWREKSRGSENSVYAVLDSHFQTVDDFQTLFRAIREQITAQDQDLAAQYKQLEATLPQQSPAPQRLLGALGMHVD
ncbi:hypothetical protein NONO_c62980 [Nocardia nova SH22a]|uniref:Uncharacterized protein n=1 Tax=Nocardia nova SH22a TaxID=1415166 RepID=W5TQ38_9NOCA|nr:hypothetical protein [Nocardia nova]AHH21068.1 hypothetical protein NONO_c62980 [Nocardia nova SH22a]